MDNRRIAKPRPLRHIYGFRGPRQLFYDKAGRRRPQPKRPSSLTGAARHEWDRVARPLYELGLLTALGAFALEGYCMTYDLYVGAQREIALLRERVKREPGLDVDPEVWRLPREWRSLLRDSAAAFGIKLRRDGRMEVPGI